MKTKRCKQCGRELPVSEFYASDSTKDGLFSVCKDCHRKKCRENYRGIKTRGKNIDWEERRYEIVKDTTMSLLRNMTFISDYFLNRDDESMKSKCKSIVDCGVMIGDYIVEQLKGR